MNKTFLEPKVLDLKQDDTSTSLITDHMIVDPTYPIPVPKLFLSDGVFN